MLEATPAAFWSWDFTVFDDSRPVAVIDASWWWEDAKILVAGASYRIARQGFFATSFTLENDRGGMLARATKPSAFFRSFDVELPRGRVLQLSAVSVFSRAFRLVENGRVVGAVAPAAWFSRRARIGLPEDLGLAERVFLFYLVLVLWRRARRESS